MGLHGENGTRRPYSSQNSVPHSVVNNSTHDRQLKQLLKECGGTKGDEAETKSVKVREWLCWFVVP